MADLLANDSPFRVVPVPGDSGLNNISRLLHDPHIDAGFVSTDFRADSETQSSVPNLAASLQVVARLCPQEVYVLAEAGIDSLADLAVNKVNFGTYGRSLAGSARILFRALYIEVEPVALDGCADIEQLTQGAIGASVFVGAKPMPV